MGGFTMHFGKPKKEPRDLPLAYQMSAARAMREKSANIGVTQILQNHNPKYASHYKGMENVQRNFLKYMTEGTDILQTPICNRCERPASFHMGGVKCRSCGHEQKDYITFGEYMEKVLKIPKSEIQAFVNAEMAKVANQL